MALSEQIQAHLHQLGAAGDEGQVIAFFDLDRTLIPGYSAIAFLLEWVRGGNKGARGLAGEILANINRRGGGKRYTGLYRSVVRAMAGVDELELQQYGVRAFERNLEASIFREARQIIDYHRQLGHKVVIVSAATTYQTSPIADALGVDAFFCTRLKTRDGVLTGDVKGGLCFGEGKVLAAQRYARSVGGSLKNSWFYSDSADDLPLLKKVGHPVATNPSDSLAACAMNREWPILRFSSRGKVNLESLLRTALTANALVSTVAAGAASWVLSRSQSTAANNMTTWLGDIGSAFAGLDFEIEGIEHLEEVRPAIFTFNHQSYLDSVVMAHLLRHDIVAFCKKELTDNPILGPILKAHGAIFVDRDSRNQSLCLRQASEAIVDGKSLVIAPEGTRSTNGELGVFKPGAFYLARKMKVPIVPVILHNVSDALPKGKLLLRPATIKVTVLPPVMPADIKNIRRLSAELRAQYSAALADSAPLDRAHYSCRASSSAITSGR